MVARAVGEASGKIWSRTSPRAGGDVEPLGAFADGIVSVRTEAGTGVVTGELCGGAEGFFSAAVFTEFCLADGTGGFAADAVPRRAGCSTGFGCSAGTAADVEADDEESERWPRILGSARMATMTNSPAATGTT